MRALAPLILADAAEAARLQLDAIDADLRPWWAGLARSRARRHLCRRARAPRPRATAISPTPTSSTCWAASTDGYRVIYAEGVYDEAGGEALLAQLLTDRAPVGRLLRRRAAHGARHSGRRRRGLGARAFRPAGHALAGGGPSTPQPRRTHDRHHLDPRPEQDLRLGPAGAEGRRPRHRARRDLRPARPQRRRQDHADRHRLRDRHRDHRHGHRRRPRHRAATSAPRAA